jgi:hypothetical protein
MVSGNTEPASGQHRKESAMKRLRHTITIVAGLALARFYRRVCLFLGSALLIGGVFFTPLASASPSATTTVRPISDLVSAQGSVLKDAGPVHGGELIVGESFIWGNSLNQLFRVDFAGTDAKALMSVGGPNVHTSFAGAIREHPLPDGRAEDTINLVTTNALAYVVDASKFPGNCSNAGHVAFINCPALFGHNLVELANGRGRPVLVTSVMTVTLVNAAPGAPMPDLAQLSFTPSAAGAYLQTLTLNTTAVGPLRAAFGVPDGTPGLATLNVTIDTSQNVDNELVSLSALGK